MQVENQQEVLGADVDKNQVENQQEILVDAAEKEQRRTTRLGAIIAIVAVIGTLCAFLFKMTISSLNVWSEQGVMYWYLQALFSFALSTSVIIFIDILFDIGFAVTLTQIVFPIFNTIPFSVGNYILK